MKNYFTAKNAVLFLLLYWGVHLTIEWGALAYGLFQLSQQAADEVNIFSALPLLVVLCGSTVVRTVILVFFYFRKWWARLVMEIFSWYYLAAAVISIAIWFAVTYLNWKPDEAEEILKELGFGDLPQQLIITLLVIDTPLRAIALLAVRSQNAHDWVGKNTKNDTKPAAII
ncbi:MAG: hypothetical protein HKM24_01990 [Gammaproteobacteria bacterium]|nr:hypothetical protein [Gammaproteobacteria bacterium]